MNLILQYSALCNQLPENINLLTLKQLDQSTLLMRLEHIYQANEDPVLSQPQEVDLNEILPMFIINSVQEMRLAANDYASSQGKHQKSHFSKHIKNFPWENSFFRYNNAERIKISMLHYCKIARICNNSVNVTCCIIVMEKCIFPWKFYSLLEFQLRRTLPSSRWRSIHLSSLSLDSTTTHATKSPRRSPRRQHKHHRQALRLQGYCFTSSTHYICYQGSCFCRIVVFLDS